MSIRHAFAAAVVVGAIAAPSAPAATHDYCFWDGSYSSNSAGTLCFASGTNKLTDNHAWMPYHPTSPTIFCGAHDADGNTYAGYTSGGFQCDHVYSGLNQLKADEWVDISATTHGTITW